MITRCTITITRLFSVFFVDWPGSAYAWDVLCCVVRHTPGVVFTCDVGLAPLFRVPYLARFSFAVITLSPRDLNVDYSIQHANKGRVVFVLLSQTMRVSLEPLPSNYMTWFFSSLVSSPAGAAVNQRQLKTTIRILQCLKCPNLLLRQGVELKEQIATSFFRTLLFSRHNLV